MSITTAGSGNWSSTTPNAPWPSGIVPGTTDDVIIAAGHTVTLDTSPTINSLTNSGNTGLLAVGTTQSLTLSSVPGITYSGTNASGFIQVTAGTLTINGQVKNTGAGTPVVTSGTGSLVISSGTNTAVWSAGSGGTGVTTAGTGTLTITGGTGTFVSGTPAVLTGANYGIGVNHAASGALTINGWVKNNGNQPCIYHASSNTGSVITGDVQSLSNIGVQNASTGTITIQGNGDTRTGTSASIFYCNNGKIIHSGTMSEANGSFAVQLVGAGCFQWIGTIAQTGNVTISSNSAATPAITLGSSSTALVMALSGRVMLYLAIGRVNGTSVITIGSQGASITLQSAAAQFCCTGQDLSAYIHGPTIPAATDVKSGTVFGYANGLTGSLSALKKIGALRA